MANLIEQLVDNAEYTGCETTMFGEPLGGGIRQTITLDAPATIGTIQFKIVMYSYTEGYPLDRLFQISIHAFDPDTEIISGDLLGLTVISTAPLSLIHNVPQMVDFVFDTPVELEIGNYALTIEDITDGLWGEFTETEGWWFTDGIYYFRAAGNEYADGSGYLVWSPIQNIGDFVFTVAEAEADLSLTPTSPEYEATGIKIAPSGLTWECEGFDPETMVFDVYFRMFGVTQFTLVGDGVTDATLPIEENLAYNFLYFWKVNVREIGTDDILLAGDEWNFNTEALIKYPIPRHRTVPSPAGGGATMTVQTAENCLKAIKHLVVASQNTLWYDYEAGV